MEIEIRAYIDSFDQMRSKLKDFSAKKSAELFIVDKWFCHGSCTCFEDTKMNEPGSYGLRLRTEKNGSKITYELNCKVIENEKDHNVFHEYETKVSNLEQTEKILQRIGFTNFCIIKKKRESYEIEGITLNLEDIENFEPVIELEILADDNVEKHKQKILDLLKKLGIAENKIIEKSITYNYMKRHAFKGDQNE